MTGDVKIAEIRVVTIRMTEQEMLDLVMALEQATVCRHASMADVPWLCGAAWVAASNALTLLRSLCKH